MKRSIKAVLVSLIKASNYLRTYLPLKQLTWFNHYEIKPYFVGYQNSIKKPFGPMDGYRYFNKIINNFLLLKMKNNI